MKRAEETIAPIPIDLSIRVELPQPELEVNWLPITPNIYPEKAEALSTNFRQTVVVAWCLDQFGTDQSIPMYDVQKYNYFLQRANLANLCISYREFARGPYSPQVTYKAGTYAKNKSFWEVKGTNVVRGRKLKEAVKAAPRVIVDIEQARLLVRRLAQLSKDDLGGFATVDFASRKIFEKGQSIKPESIRAYFQSDWSEKVNDSCYTDENILRALEMLADMGLFQKSDSGSGQTSVIKETLPERTQLMKEHTLQDTEDQTSTIEQPTLSDFGLYKCEVCGKMVMGFEREEHAQQMHKILNIEWKKIR